MGMSADQFFQVVLLPQGEFAQFLHADAGDRAKLLQRLFGTDRFRAVEDWLADAAARPPPTRSGRPRRGSPALLARVAQAAGAPDALRRPRPSDDPVPAGEAQPSAAWAAAAGRDRRRRGRGQPGSGRAPPPDLDQASDRLRDAERLADRQRRRAGRPAHPRPAGRGRPACGTGGPNSPPPPARAEVAPR